jgi:glucosamine-6-phosphate isomerase
MTNKMKLIITKDYDEMSRTAADLVIEQVKQKPASLICFPSGDSPAGMLRYLIADAAAGKVDFRQSHFVGLDEWVGLGADDDGSCTQFLNEHFFNPLNIKPPQVKFFDAKAADLEAACREMDNFVREHGPLDMMIVGIGMNGHIGLNEPGTDFNLYAHHAPLDPVTVAVGQKYFKTETTLTEGITLGLKHLQEAKTPLLIAAGSKKGPVIKQALQGEVTVRLPASIFKNLGSSVVLLDEGAAGDILGSI